MCSGGGEPGVVTGCPAFNIDIVPINILIRRKRKHHKNAVSDNNTSQKMTAIEIWQVAYTAGPSVFVWQYSAMP